MERAALSPISYEQFRTMPDEQLDSYLNELARRFNITQGDLASMLQVSTFTVSQCMKQKNLTFRFHRGRHAPQDRSGWYRFISQGTDFRAPSGRRFSMAFDGDVDLNAVNAAIRRLAGKQHLTRVELVCFCDRSAEEIRLS